MQCSRPSLQRSTRCGVSKRTVMASCASFVSRGATSAIAAARAPLSRCAWSCSHMQPMALRHPAQGGAVHIIRATQPQRRVLVSARKGKASSAAQPADSEEDVAGAQQDEEDELLNQEDEEYELYDGDYEEEDEMGEVEGIDLANAYFSIPGMIQFSQGVNDLPRLFLKHPWCDSGAEIYLHGAAITQWLRPDGSDALALRPDSNFSGTAPIESGVNIFFPQYRNGGVLDKGFANNLPWEVVAAGLDFLPVGDGFGVPHPFDEVEKQAASMSQEHASEAASTQTVSEDQGRAAGHGGTQDAAASSSEQEAGAEGEPEEAAAEGEQGEEEVFFDYEEDGLGEEGLEDLPSRAGLDAYTMLIKRQMDAGLDPAPYVTLRLTDTEETRQVWPHKFELLYKITLMETDEFDPVEPAPEDATFCTETSRTQVSKAIQAEQHLRDNADQLDPEDMTDAQLLSNAIDKEEDYALALDETIRPLTPEERMTGRRDPEEDKVHVPLQLRLELKVINKDPEGSKPMEFQAGHLAHIATKDCNSHGDFIKVRGLGGSNVIDYSEDREPTLSMCQEDYINFFGQRIDATFVNAAAADVALCPGDRSHFELLARDGYRDVILFHPGVLDGSVMEDTDAASMWAGLGAGRFMVPVELPPGREWYGCFKLRFHNHVWKEPVWGGQSMVPIDPIPRAMLENTDDGAADDDGMPTGADAADDEPAMV